ncbi:aldehyde dehydrogenase family protein, partial [Pirellulaceae bacterium]|nr:aldehyde dehydrogenase family protein [Pirellulaceae bacterium]
MSTVASLDLLPEVIQFLAQRPQSSWVGGQTVQSTGQLTFASLDPGSGEKIADVADLDAAQVDQAVDDAGQAFPGWSGLSKQQRHEILQRLASAVEDRLPVIAQIESLEAGKIESQAHGDIQNFVDTLRYFIDLDAGVSNREPMTIAGHEAWSYRHPWGVCGFIFPWNFPFLLIGWGVSPALVAGNTVVIKPAEETSLSAIYLAQLATEVGVPNGVINVV